METRPSRVQNPAVTDKALTPDEIAANLAMVRHIRAWLSHRSLTQAKLASLMGVSEGTVSKWLSGKQGMLTSQLWMLCQILKAQPHEIVCPPGETEMPEKLRRAAHLLATLPEERAARWLDIGEDMRPTPAAKEI